MVFVIYYHIINIMSKEKNIDQKSYSMGYRIGKETTIREIENWFYQNFDDMGFHVISNEEISLKEMMDDLKKRLKL